MNKEFAGMLIQVAIFLPFILGLVYITLKFGGSKLQDLQNGKFIKVLERVTLSKENSLVVAKIGDKGYVLSSTNGRIEILIQLEESELSNLQSVKQIPQYADFKELYQKLNTKRKMRDE